MDRNQQSRRQKADAASRSAKRLRQTPGQRVQPSSPKRGMGSRVGIERPADPARTAPPRSFATRSAAGTQPRRPAPESRSAPAANRPQNRRTAGDRRPASAQTRQDARPSQTAARSSRQTRPSQTRQQPATRQQQARQKAPRQTDARQNQARQNPSGPGNARQATRYRRSEQPAPPTQANRNPQSAAYRPGATRHHRRVTQVEKMRIRRRRKIMGVLCIIGVLIVGVFLSVNLLFKVTDFRVENLDRTAPANTGIYTEQQIIDLLGVQIGDNLFGFSTRTKSEQLQSQLPYLDVVQVGIQMPGTVVIKVQPATERFSMELPSGWLILSDGLKVLRTDSARPTGLIQLDAVLDPGAALTPGSYLSLQDPDAQPATAETATAETAQSRTDTVLQQLMTKLEEEQLLDGITMISVSDLEEINVLYQGRVSILLGTANNMDYKLRLAAQIVLDVDGTGLASTDRGTLDVSYQRTDGSIAAYFNPAEPSPTPAPTPAPSATPAPGAESQTGDGATPSPSPLPAA